MVSFCMLCHLDAMILQLVYFLGQDETCLDIDLPKQITHLHVRCVSICCLALWLVGSDQRSVDDGF